MHALRGSVLPLILLSALPAIAAIRGAIVDQAGAPIEGASVAAYAQETRAEVIRRIAKGTIEREPLARVAAGEDGSFRIATEGRPVVELVVSAPGRELQAFDAADGDDTGTLMLRTVKPIRGHVTAGGKPVAGAVVILGAGAAATCTGDDGAFTLPRMTGTPRIAVLHPELAPLDTFVQNDKPLELSLERGVTIRGRVVAPNGRSVAANATIFGGLWLLGETADDGTFAIEHAPSKWRTIRVASPLGGAMVTNSGAASYEVRLRPPGSFTGVVRHVKTNAPVAGVRYRLTLLGDEDVAESVITNAKGEYAMRGLAPGRYGIHSTHPLYAISTHDLMLNLAVGEDDAGVQAATPFATLRGRLIDETKEPVRAATITTIAGRGREEIETTSAPDGTFLLRTAAPAFYLEVVKDGYAPNRTRTTAAAGESKNVTITMVRGVRVAIHVNDPDGVPVSGATLAFIDATSEFSMWGAIPACGADPCVTGADGKVTVRVVPRKYDVGVTGAGIVSKFLRSQLLDAQTSPLTITVDRGVTISGRAIFSDGTPAAGATIILAPSTRAHDQAEADAAGAFAFQNAARGKVLLVATLEDSGLTSEPLEVTAPASDVVVTVPRGGRITGRVIDGATGDPVSDFTIHVMVDGPSIPPAPFATDDGTFALEHVPPGTVTLYAVASGYARATTSGIEVEEGKSVSGVELPMLRGGQVKGRVTSTDGQPLVGAMVVAQEEAGVHAPPERAATDGDGAYVLTTVPPGERTLLFRKQGFVPVDKTIEAVSGKEVRVDAVLDAGRTLRGRVVDESGQPIAAAYVVIKESMNQMRSESDGTFVLSGLVPREYNVQAVKDGFVSAREVVDVAKVDSVTLVLRRGATITGRVTGLTEAQLPYVEVAAISSRSATTGSVDAGGAFSLTGVAEGPAIVRGQLSAGSSEDREVEKMVEVVNGAAPLVELSFSEGFSITGRVTSGGKPLAGVYVSLAGVGLPLAGSAAGTANDGTFKISHVLAGDYQMSVDSAGVRLFDEPRSISGPATLDIEVRGGALRGRVIDAAARTPVAGARLLLETESQPPQARRTTSDSNGNFSFAFVPAGRWVVRTEKEMYRAAIQSVTVGDGAAEMDVQLERGTAAVLQIVDAATGSPLPAQVTVADAAGTTVFEGAAPGGGAPARVWAEPGQYTASVIQQGYVPASATFMIPGPEVRIALMPAGRISVVTITRRGRIRLSSGSFTTVSARNQIDNLAPGEYKVEIVDANDQVLATRQATVIAGQTTTVTFE